MEISRWRFARGEETEGERGEKREQTDRWRGGGIGWKIEQKTQLYLTVSLCPPPTEAACAFPGVLPCLRSCPPFHPSCPQPCCWPCSGFLLAQQLCFSHAWHSRLGMGGLWCRKHQISDVPMLGGNTWAFRGRSPFLTLWSYTNVTLSEPPFSIYEIKTVQQADAVMCISHLI